MRQDYLKIDWKGEVMSDNGLNGKKDPWRRDNRQTPPDLDELLKKLFNKFFGGVKTGSDNNSNQAIKKGFSFGAILIIPGLLLIWALSGIFIVAPAERAAVLRFGRYVNTVDPGPHWIPRLIDSEYTVNVQQVSTFPYKALMLTKDENIVSVEVAVQYRVDNITNYLFNINNPNASLQQATASALRQVIGHTTLDDILTTGRALVREQVSDQLQQIMSIYNSGILVTDVTLQPAKPPEEVTEAFDDAIKAREDEQRYINQAKAYSMKVVPVAQGQASRLIENSQAYRQRVVLQAKGDVAGYLALLPDYLRSPAVMRERLYLDSLQSVLTKSSKVLLDDRNGKNMIYLPLDQLMKQANQSSDAAAANDSASTAPAPSATDQSAATTKNPPIALRQGDYSNDNSDSDDRGGY